MQCVTLIFILFGSMLVNACYQKSESGIENESKRIVGSDATIEDFPYMARVMAKLNGKWQMNCGAVIIGEDIVLTASRCVTPDGRRTDFRIMSGSATLNGGKTHAIKATKKHHGCSGRYVDCLAVVRVKTKFEISDDSNGWIEFSDDSDDTTIGTKAIVAGWGQPDSGRYNTFSPNLRKTEVELIDTDRCAPTYTELYFPGENNEEKVFCSSLEKNQLCYADEGGPLIVNSKLIGIVAGTQFCGNVDSPALYHNILWYRNWIEGRIHDLKK